MTVTVLADVILSNQIIAQGIHGRQIRKNQRVSTASGFESVNILWDKTMREYDLGVGPLRRQDWQYLESLFEVTEGGAYGFLLQDPKDFQVSAAEGRVAEVQDAPGYYQLFKRYTERVSSRYKDRKITRPVSLGTTIYVSGVATAAAIDVTNGRLTITGDPAPSVVTWAGKFHTPVHFLNDQIEWSMAVAGIDPDGRFYTGQTVTLQEIREGLPV
jgi:uncharacterized protein (TIGR02217 family)